MSEITDLRTEMDNSPRLPDIVASDPAVSSDSRWSHDIWRLDGESGGKIAADFAIHWTVKADPVLVNDAKMLAARLFLPRDGYVELKHTTASTFSSGIRHLLRFMTQYAYTSFSQLDEGAFAFFRKNLHIKLSDPDWYEEEFGDGIELATSQDEQLDLDYGDRRSSDAVDDPTTNAKKGAAASKAGNEEDGFTRIAAYNRLRVWRQLFEHGEALEAAGVPRLLFNPFTHKSIKDVAAEASAIATDLIPPLPAPVALKIMNRAVTLIMTAADDVIRLQTEYLDAMLRLDRQPPTDERRRLKAIMEGFRFSDVKGKPWRDPIVLGPDESGGGDQLRDLVMLIRDAAVLVIFCGTGVRISELCSLTASPAVAPKSLPLFDALDEEKEIGDDLPHCVSVSTSKTGLNDHFFMHGRLFKNERVPKDETWLIGARPKGSDVEPTVLRAIRVLERLTLPWRGLADDAHVRGHLLMGFKGRGLPRSSKAVRPIRGGSLRASLKAFIADECDLASLEDQIVSDRKLAPYVKYNGGCIRTHQWRKTFALYMMKVDDRMIPPLAHHFKHMSVAVTENSYMPTDPSMLAAQDSVHMQETARYFYEQRHGAGGSFGRLDDLLTEHQEQWAKLVDDLPFEEAYPDVESFCLDRDIRIFHADHGRCLIGANPDEARCHEVSGTTSWRNSKPNHITRTPSLCTGCSNFSVSAEHAGFWRRRYISNQRSWIESDRSLQFRVIQKRAQQAAQILRALKQPVPVILRLSPSERQATRERSARAKLEREALAVSQSDSATGPASAASIGKG